MTMPVCTGAQGSGHNWPGEDYYDISKRAPQFARADRACWWELSSLCGHVHPSVAAMAGALLAGTSVVYDGDPLGDLTVLAFLDKFVKRCALHADHRIMYLPAGPKDGQGVSKRGNMSTCRNRIDPASHQIHYKGLLPR